MQLDISQWVELLGNGAAVGVIIYALVDTARNWGGNPELKILREDLKQTHKDLRALIQKLP